jgi:NAD(P)-dependent dehydrogenase (short-subunit alcohol dehydrogenase family)
MTGTTLENLNFLISGGTQGLGKALVRELIHRKARVATFARNEEAVNNLKQEIPQAHVFRADVSKKHEINAIALRAIEALGGEVHVLVNNASTLGPKSLRPLLDTDCEDLEAALQANLLGPFRLTKAVAGNMLLHGGGLVVNITSDASVNAYPNWGAYSVTKAALDHLTRLQNAELKPHNIDSVAVDPGDLRTALHFQAVPGADPALLKVPEQAARELADYLERGDFAKERIRL